MSKVLVNDGKIICFDLDGVIAIGTYRSSNDETEKEPNQKIISEMNRLWLRGWVIHIYTSRPYQMMDNTVAWLKKHKVPYHSIDFNKPLADFYVDDRMYPMLYLENLDTGDWNNPEEVRKELFKQDQERMAQFLHRAYLSAVKHLRPESFNSEANKPWEELTEEQKSIDLFIADWLIQRAELEETCLTERMDYPRD